MKMMMVMMVMEVMLLFFAFLVLKRKFPNGSRVRSKPNKEKDGDVTCFSSIKEIWLGSKIRSKPKKKKKKMVVVVVVVVLLLLLQAIFFLGIMKFD